MPGDGITTTLAQFRNVSDETKLETAGTAIGTKE